MVSMLYVLIPNRYTIIPEPNPQPPQTVYYGSFNLSSNESLNMTFLDRTNDSLLLLRHPHPSYLFSYGGSGNTVTRIILEHVTNIWTASNFNDKELKKIGFTGETQSCGGKDRVDRPVLLIKAHPEVLDRVRSNPKNFFRRCLGIKDKAPPLHYNDSNAVFIVRNPWKAIFTMFQFKHGYHNQSKHTRSKCK